MIKIDLSKVFSEISRTAIQFDFITGSSKPLVVGTSKFGGNQDVPPNFVWFYYEGENWDGERRNRPLSFLAQINCEEIKKFGKDNLLPAKGILYFFYELSTMGFEPI